MAVYRWGFDRETIEAAAQAACAKVEKVTIQRADVYIETSEALDIAEAAAVAAALAATGPILTASE